MEQDKISEKLLNYIDGILSKEESALLESEMDQDPELKKEYNKLKNITDHIDKAQPIEIPSDRMTKRYLNWLETQVEVTPKINRFSFYKIAAGVALLLTVGIGAWSLQTLKKQRAALAQIQQELVVTKTMILSKVADPLSASTRMQAVQASYELDAPDDEILQVLIKTLNDDPNSNVRIAALEALQKFYAIPTVKQALIQSLKTQKDPLVQITLIQILATMKEKSILQDLQNFTEDPALLKAVKDEAYQAIFKLT